MPPYRRKRSRVCLGLCQWRFAWLLYFLHTTMERRSDSRRCFLIPRSVGFSSVGGIGEEDNNAMKGFVGSIEKAAQQNKTFRTVLYTAKNCQLVVMSLKPGEDIGAEVHKLDQFFRVEEGEGKAVLDGIEHRIKPGFAILVPAGARHNIINGPSGPMKLYTLYAPPNHRDGVVHATKAEAEADKEHFDGKTTE